MPHKKLQLAVEKSGCCCPAKLLTEHPTIKAVMRFTDASESAIKIWRRDLRKGRWNCECEKEKANGVESGASETPTTSGSAETGSC